MDSKIFGWWCSLQDKERFRIIEEAYHEDNNTA